MKNLFDYATKELSQDAFLRWLFENYNCENEGVKKACRKLFDSFTNNNDEFKDKTITELKTVSQWKNIDISVWFTVEEKDYLIFPFFYYRSAPDSSQFSFLHRIVNIEKTKNGTKGHIFYIPFGDEK